MEQVLETLANGSIEVLDIVALGGVAAVVIAVWRRVRVKLPGGIQVGHEPGEEVQALLDILEQQRAGYDHLATRVEVLEDRVSELENQLVEARRRETALEEELATERASAGARITELEQALAAAQARIAALETELAEARAARPS
jgi:DNA repair exonuclease SbcCD ATPase subunit